MGNLYLYLYFCLHLYVFVLEGGLPPTATTTFRINHTFHLFFYSSTPSDRQSWAPFLEPDHITQIRLRVKLNHLHGADELKTGESLETKRTAKLSPRWKQNCIIPMWCGSTVAQLCCIRVAAHNLVSAPKSCFNWHPGLFLTQVLMLQTVAGQ